MMTSHGSHGLLKRCHPELPSQEPCLSEASKYCYTGLAANTTKNPVSHVNSRASVVLSSELKKKQLMTAWTQRWDG
jgi:hypothetical protein